MEKIKTFIVDDVLSNRDRLKELLVAYCPLVEVCGSANSVASAVELIGAHKPDLVFLDVELPDGSGFDILQFFQPVPFRVIFFTGHLEYAFQAIKFHAADYLLKPVVPKELIEAVDLAARQILDGNYSKKLESTRQQIIYPDKLIIPDSGGFQAVDDNEIIMFEADGNYTHLYLTGNRKMTCCRILKDFHELLKGRGHFIRSHKSYIVNLNHVKSYSHQGIIKLTEGLTANLGNTYREDFLVHFLIKKKDFH